MATKSKKQMYIVPGKDALECFMRDNSGMLNLSEMERLCNFPPGTLRHIRAGSRTATTEQYKKIQEVILPKMCEFVFILQNYNGIDRRIPVSF